jgi:hypothetical protein
MIFRLNLRKYGSTLDAVIVVEAVEEVRASNKERGLKKSSN